MSECSLSKKERLKSVKVIQQLFAEGLSFSVYPIRVVYLVQEMSPNDIDQLPMQVAFSVGKRKFPKAVTRNLIKRRMRAAYQTQKAEGLANISFPLQRQFAVIFLYVGKDVLPSVRIHGAMRKCLKKLATLPLKNAETDQPIS